jgi:hypothetical protein
MNFHDVPENKNIKKYNVSKLYVKFYKIKYNF